MFMFGSGLLWGTPLADAAGNALANPTPLLFGTMQDSELDFKFELKQLHGQNQFAVAVGRGKGMVTGKAKIADIRAAFLETIVFGLSGTNALTSAVYDTVGAAAAASVAVTPPASGVWAADLGVINSVTGREMRRVPSAPTTGQYSVSNGTYTFAAADVGVLMYINYRFTGTSTVARRMSITNQPMGYTPSFRADFYGPYMGKSCVLTLNNCVSDGFKLANKNDDFSVPEVGFTCFADNAGVIGVLSVSE
jgi:hypothetical protein